jgi:hypothetical protein
LRGFTPGGIIGDALPVVERGGMRRRRVYVGLALSTAALLVAGYLWFRSIVGFPVSSAALARIQPGVSQHEVRGIVGWPPSATLAQSRGPVDIWEGSNGRLQVFYDGSGHVSWTTFDNDHDAWIRRLYSALGLPLG